MHLSDEQLRAVLARAEDIQRSSSVSNAWNTEVQLIVEAAEELGLSRQSIERALAERRDFFPEPPRVGQLTWARSTDGKYYVAQVLGVSSNGATVQFLRGGELNVGADGLRPCAFLPGERIACDWPWWGPWTCSVVGYEPDSRMVRLNDGWGASESFHIADVWIAPDKKPVTRSRLLWKMMAIGAAMGTVVGAFAAFLALR